MSLVIRVMITPAFSAVKKSSDSRCRWVKTLTRRSFITHAANRPVTLHLGPLCQRGERHEGEIDRGDDEHDAQVAVTGHHALVDGNSVSLGPAWSATLVAITSTVVTTSMRGYSRSSPHRVRRLRSLAVCCWEKSTSGSPWSGSSARSASTPA